MKKVFCRFKSILFAVILLSVCSASASELHDFASDGCTLFPDGNSKDRSLWCDRCLVHDIAYWQGGTKEERMRVGEKLRACVMDRTKSKALANMMYDGVRTGGHPAFHTLYRWGYKHSGH